MQQNSNKAFGRYDLMEVVNDELTSTAMKNLFLEKWPDLVVSISTIKRVRRRLGWADFK